MANPHVVVIALVVRRGLLLAGERQRGAGAPFCPFPAGYLLRGEGIVDAVNRASSDEVGVRCQVRPPHQHSPIWLTGRASLNRADHITLFVLADWLAGDLATPDPGQSTDWRWVKVSELAVQPGVTFETHAGWLPIRWLESLRDRKRVSLR